VSQSVLVFKTATAAVIAAAVVLCVGASGYALFVFAEPRVGPAAAAGIVALAAAFVAVLAVLVLRLVDAEEPRRATKGGGGGLNDYLIDIALDRPIATAAVALAVGWFCVRNPKALATAAEFLADRGHSRRR
jgi:hypothetical protein